MIRALLVIALLAVTASEPSTAQAGALAGVDSVDARIFMMWDDDLKLNEEIVRSRLLTLLELELRKAGIFRDSSITPSRRL